MIILIQGQCSDRWSGFDGCPVALAGIGTYCRTKAQVDVSLLCIRLSCISSSGICTLHMYIRLYICRYFPIIFV